MSGTFAEFRLALGHNESWNQYDYLNPVGYAGYYQFGEEALSALGYYRPDGSSSIDWRGSWTGKDGIDSVQEFLATPAAQENAFGEWCHFLWNDICKPMGLDDYVGKTVNGVTITESGLLAGAHLVGGPALRTWLETGYDGADVFGTPVSQYVRDYGGYSIDGLSAAEAAPISSATAPEIATATEIPEPPAETSVTAETATTTTQIPDATVTTTVTQPSVAETQSGATTNAAVSETKVDQAEAAQAAAPHVVAGEQAQEPEIQSAGQASSSNDSVVGALDIVTEPEVSRDGPSHTTTQVSETEAVASDVFDFGALAHGKHEGMGGKPAPHAAPADFASLLDLRSELTSGACAKGLEKALERIDAHLSAIDEHASVSDMTSADQSGHGHAHCVHFHFHL